MFVKNVDFDFYLILPLTFRGYDGDGRKSPPCEKKLEVILTF
jgi:hypothetical protein